MEDGPLAAYRALRPSGKLQPDPAQAVGAEKLLSPHTTLKRYRPALGQSGWGGRLGPALHLGDPPQGLHIFAGVGRGQSMLIDLFFEGAPVAAKRWVHFHAFMLDAHERLKQLRHRGGNCDPVPRLARELAAESWLLCFDEFHVRNIADATRPGRLFERLFENGVVVAPASSGRSTCSTKARLR